MSARCLHCDHLHALRERCGQLGCPCTFGVVSMVDQERLADAIGSVAPAPELPHETDRAQADADAAGDLLETLGLTPDPETPGRMARALRELTAGYDVKDLGALLKSFPAPADPGIVCVRDIPFASLCEHHVLPFTGTVSVAYIPQAVVVGLSKIPRLVRAVTRRLQLQERIGATIADVLTSSLTPIGVMVIVRARHTCMGLRGVESPGEMVTSCVRGVFASDAAARAEAMGLLRSS